MGNQTKQYIHTQLRLEHETLAEIHLQNYQFSDNSFLQLLSVHGAIVPVSTQVCQPKVQGDVLFVGTTVHVVRQGKMPMFTDEDGHCIYAVRLLFEPIHSLVESVVGTINGINGIRVNCSHYGLKR